MSLENIIEKTKEPQTLETLIEDFKKLGLENDDTIMLHVSQSAIGYIIGATETLFNALTRVIGPLGTMIVSTQTMDNSDPKNWNNPKIKEEWIELIKEQIPAYDPKITQTRNMGAFSEYIRNHPYRERSKHPQVSFAAIGFHAKKITKKHDLTPKFGMTSPLGAIYNLKNAKIIMIGTNLDKATGLHLAEVLSSGYNKKIKESCAMFVDNKRKWVTYEDKDYNSDNFLLIEKDYLKNNKIEEGFIGNAKTRVYDFNHIVDYAVKWLDRVKK